MKAIKTYSQLQAARSKHTQLLKKHGLVATGETKGDRKEFVAFMTEEDELEIKQLQQAIAIAEPYEAEMKALHTKFQTKSHSPLKSKAKPMKKKQAIETLLEQKAILLPQVQIAIDSELQAGIRSRLRDQDGVTKDTDMPSESNVNFVPEPIANKNAPVVRFQETDGTLSYVRPQNSGMNLVRPEVHKSRKMSKELVSKEAQTDVINNEVQAYYLDNVADTFAEEFGEELVYGDPASGELRGLLNRYDVTESAKPDSAPDVNDQRPIEYLQAFNSGVDGQLGDGSITPIGADARQKLLDFIATAKTSIKGTMKFYMHPSVLAEYRSFTDTQGQPLFKYENSMLEDVPVEVAEKFPEYDGTTAQALFILGDLNRTQKVKMLPSDYIVNPYIADGATTIQQTHHVANYIVDNTASRIFFAG